MGMQLLQKQIKSTSN